jgi:hypothetical protein
MAPSAMLFGGSMRLIPLLCVLLALPVVARAQEPPPPVDPAKFEAAKVHYDKGKEHQLAGRYPEAVAEYERAYEISKAPELRFIIAQAHQLDKKPKLAIAAYEEYLRLLPDGPLAKEATLYLADLRAAEKRAALTKTEAQEDAEYDAARAAERKIWEDSQRGFHLSAIANVDLALGVGAQLMAKVGIGHGVDLFVDGTVMQLWKDEYTRKHSFSFTGGARARFGPVPIFAGLGVGYARGYVHTTGFSPHLPGRGVVATASIGWTGGLTERIEILLQTDLVTALLDQGFVRRFTLCFGYRFL